MAIQKYLRFIDEFEETARKRVFSMDLGQYEKGVLEIIENVTLMMEAEAMRMGYPIGV